MQAPDGRPSEAPRAALVFALVAFALGAGLVAMTRATFVATFHDDAFYYLTIARHVAAGDGVTFDGVHATSGFHPLWLAMLVPIFRAGAGDLGGLAATHAIEIALVATAATIAYVTFAPRLGRAAAAIVAMGPVALPGAAAGMRGGMEGGLMLLLLVAIWCRWLAIRDDPRAGTRRWLGLGALAALLVLGRLDAIVAVAGLTAMAWPRLRRAPRHAIALLAPPVAVAAVYLSVLRATTGAWLPVNALVKAQLAATMPLPLRLRMALDVPWPGERLLAIATHGPLWWGPTWPRVVNLATLAIVAAIAWRWRRTWVARVRDAGAGFAVMAGTTMTAIVLVGVGLLQDWYLPPLSLAIAAVVGAIAAPSPRLARGLATATVAVLALRPAWAWVDSRVRPAPFTVERLAAAAWLEANARGPVGAWDSGMLGYFSHREVIPLDGLVNDVAFYRDVVVGRRLDDYLRAERVELLAIPTCEATPTSPVAGYATLRVYFVDRRACWGDAVFGRDVAR